MLGSRARTKPPAPTRLLLILTLGLVTTVATVPARPVAADSAASVHRRLHVARETRAQAEAAAQLAEQRYETLHALYQQVQAQVESAAADVVGATVQQRALSQQVDAEQQTLDEKAADAYMRGPGTSLELLLGSRSPAQFSSAQEYASRSISVTDQTVAWLQRDRASLTLVSAQLERRRADLVVHARRMQELDAAMAEQLATAQAEAARAGLAVKGLLERQRALQQAAALDDAIVNGLIDPGAGVDQSALLALLGPAHGRGCTIPSGLQLTGERRSGLASWYGADFAGKPTATGAIFDPRLFTAANKTLPLNEFLRVHYQDRCAIVLVNDRGPYGLGRSFDLAEAVATYLGYHSAGVVHVTTDVLIPRSDSAPRP
jgi:hypothetical protein